MRAEGQRQSVVDVAQLSKSYGERPVLSEVSFTVFAGERFCIIGPNGSGKSTLFSILSGIRYPDSGLVRVFGCPPGEPALKRRRGVQNDQPSFPFYSKVKEIVWLFSGLHPRPLDGAALLRALQLNPDNYIRHLSRGQRQKLGTLLALIGDPDLLLLDEPSSALDPKSRVQLWRIINEHLAQHPERSLLFSTHDLAEAQQWADRVALLHEGRILAAGSVQELLSRCIGTRMKLTLLRNGKDPAEQLKLQELPQGLVKTTASIGPEFVLYSDDSRELVSRLPLDVFPQVRIEPVSLHDVFFKLTGEALDG